MDYRDRITIEPGKRGGKPCIRGLRITVYDVLDYLAAGTTDAGSSDVRDVGLASADDEAVWTFAAQQGLSIVSKDSDFRQPRSRDRLAERAWLLLGCGRMASTAPLQRGENRAS